MWVRLRWDDTRGTPGFFLTDAARGQRLAPGYDGWFAGVPVRINSLGFRDRRDYTLEKPADADPHSRARRLGHVWPRHARRHHLSLSARAAPAGVAARRELGSVEPRRSRLQHPPGADLPATRSARSPSRTWWWSASFRMTSPATMRPQPPPSRLRRAVGGHLRIIQRHLYSYEFYKRALLTAAVAIVDVGSAIGCASNTWRRSSS